MQPAYARSSVRTTADCSVCFETHRNNEKRGKQKTHLNVLTFPLNATQHKSLMMKQTFIFGKNCGLRYAFTQNQVLDGNRAETLASASPVALRSASPGSPHKFTAQNSEYTTSSCSGLWRSLAHGWKG